MDKVIIVPEKVDDIYGLYMDLRKSEFAVRNVGLDKEGTRIYIDEKETKDPVPVVRSWVGRPAPEVTLSLKKKRAREYEEILEREHKAEEERKASEAKLLEVGNLIEMAASSNPTDLGASPVSFQDAEGKPIGELLEGKVSQDDEKKPGFFSKLLKKLF